MTEKRFIFQNQEQHLNKIYDIEKGRVVFDEDIVDLLNEQHETIQSLISNSEKYRKLSIQFDNRNKELVSENALLEKENEQLKSELRGMQELLKSYRKTIKHDAELLADATKNGYLPPLEDWKGDVE